MKSMENNGIIYKITSPSRRVYIGQTIDLKTRLAKYKNLNCKNQTRLIKSLKKYGWENHKFEILEKEIPLEFLDAYEIKYIKEYNSFITGLNCTEGGQGQKGRLVSKKTREKMKNSQLGKKQSKETINKRVSKVKGIKRSEEFKKRMSIKSKGRILSEQTKEKLRLHNLGKLSNNRLSCTLTNVESGQIWIAFSLVHLSKISPISLPTITRLKSKKASKKISDKYTLTIN